MTFYKYFPDKTSLAKTIYTNVIEEAWEKFNKLMEEEIPTDEKIKKIILLKAEGSQHISQEFLNDFYLGSEPGLRRFVEEKNRETWQRLLKNYRNAQKNGIFRDDFKPEFFIKASFKLIELFEDKDLTRLYGRPQDLILELTNLIVYGISPRK